MTFEIKSEPQKVLSRRITVAITVAAALLGMLALYRANHYPRTDDAEVFANFIGIAPQVDGPILRLNVHDNQFVRKGELLFEIDERPYQYALEKATSDQATLEGQITDEQRRIAALVSAVSGSQANVHSAQADATRWAAAIDEARANVSNAEQGVSRTKAEWTYAANNLHRLEPLLAKQFVTVDQVDRARTSEIAESEALKQAESQLRMWQAELKPALVTNLSISEGAYAHVGQQVFTLIDARTWWAIGNFREGELQHIVPGMRADVYVLSKPSLRFTGVVDSVGFGVTPDPDVFGRLEPGLPDAQRTLNWVHLASRYPVRVRVQNPSPELFRVGESAVVTIRGD